MKNKRSTLLVRYSKEFLSTRRDKLDELLRVYEDLEVTLKGLRRMAARSALKGANGSLQSINFKKLVTQLSRSKKRLEKKIGNTLLMETVAIRKRFGAISKRFTRHLPQDSI